jgi:general secretion pathway protein B
MSFILDALKKLEHKQKPGSVPDLLTVQEKPPEGPKKRPLWPYLLFTVLLLNAVLFIVWLYPWQTEKQIVDPRYSEQKQEAEKSPAAIHAPRQERTMVSETNKREKREPESFPEQDRNVPGTTRNPLQSDEKTSPVHREAPSEDSSPEKSEPELPIIGTFDIAPSLHEPPSAITTTPTELQPSEPPVKEVEKGGATLHELPESVRENVPHISISGHIYSNIPASRIATINGQIVREGDSVSDGLRVVEITPSGVILSYEGYRFHIRAF